MPSLPPSPIPPTPPAGRAHVVAQWAQALRNRADSAALQQLPPLTDAEAAQVMAQLRGDGSHPPGHGPVPNTPDGVVLSLIHISEPTRPLYISYAVFCLKKKT